MTDVEFANELDAARRIVAHGYTKEKCPVCKGTGWLFTDDRALATMPLGREIPCFGCGGRGFKWKAPIT